MNKFFKFGQHVARNSKRIKRAGGIGDIFGAAGKWFRGLGGAADAANAAPLARAGRQLPPPPPRGLDAPKEIVSAPDGGISWTTGGRKTPVETTYFSPAEIAEWRSRGAPPPPAVPSPTAAPSPPPPKPVPAGAPKADPTRPGRDARLRGLTPPGIE